MDHPLRLPRLRPSPFLSNALDCSSPAASSAADKILLSVSGRNPLSAVLLALAHALRGRAAAAALTLLDLFCLDPSIAHHDVAPAVFEALFLPDLLPALYWFADQGSRILSSASLRRGSQKDEEDEERSRPPFHLLPSHRRKKKLSICSSASGWPSRQDIGQLIASHYPSKNEQLLDEVLATFVLHHPEHGHAVIHPILSLIIDGTLVYNRNASPFLSFIYLFSHNSEKEYSEQWALACGEILRVLTHYNRPIHKVEPCNSQIERSNSGNHASTSKISKTEANHTLQQEDRKQLRPLSAWITDILLAAPLGIRSDYFRWCAGIMGKYAAGGDLKPPTIACSRGAGKHPQLMPSTPRWAVANGAGVILSVCDEEVAHYETANLTATAVPALLLPPPKNALDEHLVATLPALEPYSRLFHRYYAIATPSATQRLLLGLLEAPPSRAPDALDAAVQLVELLRAAASKSFNICRAPISIMDGILVAIKDEIDCLPYPTTGGTTWLHKYRPCIDDASCVRQLRSCGAILVGKTNMHDLGAGTSGINPHYGATRNPCDINKVSGGLSSGSAAVVCAGLCPVALGVDGGGSVRMPAACVVLLDSNQLQVAYRIQGFFH